MTTIPWWADERTGSIVGYEQITDLSAAVALTVPAGAAKAEIDVEGQPVRYRVDGTDPTADVGMGPFDAGTRLEVRNPDLSAIRFIETASGAILNVTYYGA